MLENNWQILTVFLITSADEFQRLDNERRFAENYCADGRVWAGLAERYKSQGRLAQAASCRRRAEHYASVSVETEPA